ncbi:MAG: hypothetical protein LBR25_04995 [Erysipelotrichaceae bacterium]|jgi:hypothetical protein|nr:hypothetical protein [Erysipelotrichaceae bacterium]
MPFGLFKKKEKEEVLEVDIPKQVYVFDVNDRENVGEELLLQTVKSQYGLPQDIPVHHISGSQYLGYKATGTAPSDMTSKALKSAEWLFAKLEKDYGLSKNQWKKYRTQKMLNVAGADKKKSIYAVYLIL